MLQAKELAREKGCKKERSADPAAERQYDAVIQQARTARERTKCYAASNHRAVLIWGALVALMCALTAASRDIIRDTKAAIAPRKNEGATAFEKICVSLSMSGTNSMLQLLHPLAWCEFAISVSFLPREHRLMCAARRSDAQCAYQRLPTRLTGPR